MRCLECINHAVFDTPAYCKEHFLAYFENKVRETIATYNLIKKGQRIAVAVSGGKDSLTILTLLHKWYENVTAIAIDEGIAGYREHTLKDAQRICQENKIPLCITSYKEFMGFTLDEILKKKKLHPCTVCGAFRRHLLATASKEFDVLATGHNADDEAQAVLMNIIKGNTELFTRLGPVSGNGPTQFTQRVKPLYFCTEKEVMAYAYLNGLVDSFTECPNVHESYRQIIRDELNTYTKTRPQAKQQLLQRFLKAKQSLPHKKISLQQCTTCGEPSSRAQCKVCEYVSLLSTIKKDKI